MSNELREILMRLVGRILFSLPLLLLGRLFLEKQLLNHSLEEPNSSAIVWLPFAAIICFGIVGILVASPLAHLVAYPIMNLFFPSGSHEKPPPLYTVPEWLSKEGRMEEAVEEYEKIIRNHPQELNAHLALIKIFQENLPDRERESRVFKRALKELRAKSDRQVIKNTQRTAM